MLGTGWHRICDILMIATHPNEVHKTGLSTVTRGAVRNALDDLHERGAIAYNGNKKRVNILI